jgi:hypothetical protein
MLNSRKLFRALALTGLLALGGSSAFAQICSGLLTTTNLAVRPEGLTELTGDIVVNCQPAFGAPPGSALLPTSFTVLVQLTTGVAITNTATTGVSAPSISFGFLGTPVTGAGTIAYPTGLPNAISVGATITGGVADAFTIRGIRINANAASQAGITSVSATLVITTISAGGTTVLPLANNPSLVATILPKSLNFTVVGGANASTSPAPGPLVFPICISNSAVSGFFRFSENFSNVLRNLSQENPGASNSTYLRILLTGIPAGATVLVPNSSFTTGNNILTPVGTTVGSTVSAVTGSVYTPAAGDVAYGAAYVNPTPPPTTFGNNGAGTYGAASAEVLYSVETLTIAPGSSVVTGNSTATIDTLNIPFIVRYTGGPGIGVGPTTARGGLGPVTTSSSTIPRFADVTDSATAFRTERCATTLMWPYVTTAGGFDTGIAIANTTADPAIFGTPNQTGGCTIYPFGRYSSGGTVPGPGTIPSIPAGEVWAAALTDGGIFQGGARIGTGFTGYLIAQCDFQLAHGYGFIATYGLAGSNAVAQGYLALVLDRNSGSRTVNAGAATIEALNN